MREKTVFEEHTILVGALFADMTIWLGDAC